MSMSRRRFVHLSLAAGVAAAAGSISPAFARSRVGAAPLKILILGGTGFLGPACSESAIARGHHVTLFNRGRTEDRRKRAGRPSNIPDGVDVLYGNRDPNKTADDDDSDTAGDTKLENSPKGLTQLEGKKWDAVIDTSGYWPRIVKASAELLAPSVKQYVFISTLSVYARNDQPNADETADLATLEDPTIEDFGADYRNYGGGKALSEKAAEAAMPGRVTNIRPGFIVGPRDSSGRWLYWPVRASKGGDMIVPGVEADPIQIIDVRDLADFILHCIESGTMGVFDATGPAESLSMRAMVDGCIKGAGADTKAHWLTADFLESQGVPTGGFPLWIPPMGEGAGFHRRNISKALKAGLTFRPIEDTTRAALAWYGSLPEDLQKKVVPTMLDPAKEAEVLAKWREKG